VVLASVISAEAAEPIVAFFLFLLAAPIAAWIVRHLNARVLGTAVGGFILLVNANTFLGAVGSGPSLNTLVYAAILAVWVTALYLAIGRRPPAQAGAGNLGVARQIKLDAASGRGLRSPTGFFA